MSRGSTHLLRAVIFLLGLIVLGICLFALPIAIRGELAGDFDYLPLLLGMYIPAFPFFFALYQALKILGYIDANTAFSELSITALRKIKYCGLIISGFYLLCMPYIFYLAELDDAPGLILIGFVFVGAAFVVATAAAVLEKLLWSAIEIKSENEMVI